MSVDSGPMDGNNLSPWRGGGDLNTTVKDSRLATIDPTSHPGWDAFVADHPAGTIFHTSAWARVLKEAYGYKPTAYVLTDDKGQIRAALPVCLVQNRFGQPRLVSLPFCDRAAPLAGTEEELARLVSGARAEVDAGKAAFLEVRGGIAPSRAGALGLIGQSHYYNYVIPIHLGTAYLENNLHSSAKRAIRKAEREGVTVRLSTSEEDLARFYQLNVWTRKKHGVIPQPLSFFQAIHRHLLSQDKGFLLLAELNGKVIAGDLVLASHKVAFYKFNASDRRFLHLRPNNLLLWKAVEVCQDKGYHFFDLGRCSAKDEGLRRFKSLWASQEEELPYYYYPAAMGVNTIQESSLKFRLMQMFVRKAPPRLLQMIGALIYKYVG